MHELAAGCDMLVVTTSGGTQLEGLVDADVLDALGPGGFLVTVARGSVFTDEPRVPGALLSRDDVVVLEHLTSGAGETRAAMADLVLGNVARFPRLGRAGQPH